MLANVDMSLGRTLLTQWTVLRNVLCDSSGITTTDIETESVLNHIIAHKYTTVLRRAYGSEFTHVTICERQKPSLDKLFGRRAQRGFNL
jgi:hypothetical protein